MILVYLGTALWGWLIINKAAERFAAWISRGPLTPTDRYCGWADQRLDELARTPAEPIGPYGICPDTIPASWTRETAS